MIDPKFIVMMEYTKREARALFEKHMPYLNLDELLKEADEKIIFDDNLDPDLFRHLIKKYYYTKQELG